MIDTNLDHIEEVLTRGVSEIIQKDELRDKMMSGKTLRIKLGIDPTSPNLHLGRSVPLLKLRDFQNLGHQVVFIVGDFTGVIGDTSDKDSERPMLDEETIKKNLENYIDQVGKIIDISKCEIHSNSKWLSSLNYRDIGRQSNVFSLNEFISRENIARRLDEGKRVSLREVLYPLMQGYDSVAVSADVELGGTDQKFNLLAGRELQREYNQDPQNILMCPIIEGLDGRKMSSSWGNTINFLDSARDMFGKIMTLKDELLFTYFELVTRVPVIKIREYEELLRNGANPRDIKIELAVEIVSMYHSKEDALKEKEFFIETFSKGHIDESEIETITPTSFDLITILRETNFAESNTEARRLIEDGSVKVNNEVVKDVKYVCVNGDIIQKGKRFFIKIG